MLGLCLTLLHIPASADPADGNEFQLMTEDLPPYSYLENEKPSGLAVELVRAICRRIGHPDNIKIHSWAIAYDLARSQDNRILFSTARTPDRENVFKWVGPIVHDRLFFFARSDSKLSIRSLDDARAVRKIGTYKDDVAEKFLIGKGFTNLDSVMAAPLNARKLAAGRIDLWIENFITGHESARRAGLAGKIVPIFEVSSSDLYIAFSRSTPDKVIAEWQGALDAMKSDGEYRDIYLRFGYTQP